MSAALPVERREAPWAGRTRGRAVVLGAAAAVAVWFIVAHAAPYVVPDALHAGRYVASRRPARRAQLNLASRA